MELAAKGLLTRGLAGGGLGRGHPVRGLRGGVLPEDAEAGEDVGRQFAEISPISLFSTEGSGS